MNPSPYPLPKGERNCFFEPLTLPSPLQGEETRVEELIQ